MVSPLFNDTRIEHALTTLEWFTPLNIFPGFNPGQVKLETFYLYRKGTINIYIHCCQQGEQ